jgi:hypothetical protein
MVCQSCINSSFCSTTGIFLHSVDRFDEASEHPEVTTTDGSDTTPLLDRKAAGTTETEP